MVAARVSKPSRSIVRKRLERIIEEETLEGDYLFVYGTLLSDQPNSAQLDGKVRFVGKARAHNGALLLHDLPHKQYPFFINDSRLLHQLQENTGIQPHSVVGELYEVTDDSLFQGLDPLEGITPHFDLDDLDSSIPLTNLYIRRKVSVKTNEGKVVRAHCYVANHSKSNVRNLVDKLRTKIVVPLGDWAKYNNDRHQDSLTTHTYVKDTIGMETEFSFLIDKDGEQQPLPLLKSKGYYRFTFKGSRQVRRYRTLTHLLSQAMFSALQKEGITTGFLMRYYELQPEINRRFLIPGGMAYVDGEFIENDGLATGVQRLYDPMARAQLKAEEKMPVPKTNSCLPDAFKYFEVTGFPSQIERGFATKYAVTELVRRHKLSLALEDIVIVHTNKTQSTQFQVVGNSSQYSFVLDPIMVLSDDHEGIDLSSKKVVVGDHTETRNEVSKFTRDVAYVLGRTFGPLLSYLLSGVDTSYVEFKTRPDNRLEYRNTVIYDPWQLASGLAVYAAAVRAVETKIKQYVLAKAEIEDSSLSKKTVFEIYKNITPEELVEACSICFDVTYTNARFRPGFLVSPEDSYHGKVCTSLEEAVDITINREQKSVSVKKAIDQLYHDADFQKALALVATPDEIQTIERYLSGTYTPESHSGGTRSVTSKNLAQQYLIFTGDEISTYLLKEDTFIDFASHFIFDQCGMVSIEDRTHCMEVYLNGNLQHPDSQITIGSLPLEVRLLKFTGNKKGSWEEVDKFDVRLDPTNYRKLQEGLNAPANHPQYKVWEIFYKLK